MSAATARRARATTSWRPSPRASWSACASTTAGRCGTRPMIGARGEVRAFGNLTDIRGRPGDRSRPGAGDGLGGPARGRRTALGPARVGARHRRQPDAVDGRPLRVRHHRQRRRRGAHARQRQDQVGDAAHPVSRRGAQAAGPVVGPGAGRRPPADRRHAGRAAGRLALYRRDPGQDGSARPDPARAGDRQPHDLRLDRRRAGSLPSADDTAVAELQGSPSSAGPMSASRPCSIAWSAGAAPSSTTRRA